MTTWATYVIYFVVKHRVGTMLIAEYERHDGVIVEVHSNTDGTFNVYDNHREVQSNLTPVEVVGYLCHCMHNAQYLIQKYKTTATG